MRNSSMLSRRRSGTSSSVVVFAVVAQLLLMTAAVAAAKSLSSNNNDIPYRLLAKVVQEKISQNSDSENFEADQEIPSIQKLAKTLSKLASSQQTFKVSFVVVVVDVVIAKKNRSCK
ncbi:MAG: hypothetical protein ACI8RD_003322 [Bacillariaceae sp.]|jgi:hypothetical protein